jgi:hypothetical protein
MVQHSVLGGFSSELPDRGQAEIDGGRRVALLVQTTPVLLDRGAIVYMMKEDRGNAPGPRSCSPSERSFASCGELPADTLDLSGEQRPAAIVEMVEPARLWSGAPSSGRWRSGSRRQGSALRA